MPTENENTLGSIAETKGVSIQESSELKLDRFHRCYKAVRVVANGRSDNIEHSVTEATDVQDVAPFRSLRRSVRLDIDADQLRTVGVSTRQPNLILHELLPFGQRPSAPLQHPQTRHVAATC